MNTMSKLLLSTLAILVMAGCATAPKVDYTAFKQNKPKSILVLPPVNNSPDIRGTYSFLSTTTKPIAEAGYYVFPVAVVDQTFKQNGITVPAEMHAVPAKKLREIFGADAAMYITLKQYGSKYQVLSTVTTVEADAKLVDLRTGQELWKSTKKIAASDNNKSSGLVGALVTAAVNQALNHKLDSGHGVSRTVSNILFTPNQKQTSGLLYGHRAAEKPMNK